MSEKLNVIITGATGMIGEGVLHECLQHSQVEKVLVVGRSSTGYVHPKLTEIIHKDFFDLTPLNDRLRGYSACYFCLGTTSVGKTEAEYTKFTYTLTMNFANTLATLNPGMTFCFISGVGTDSTEKGRTMWARVKGKAENDLMKLPFKGVYNFRPGGIIPTLLLKPTQTYFKTYQYMGWLFPIMKVLTPNYVIPLNDLSKAMINASLVGYEKSIIDVKDMKKLAKAR